MASGAVDTDPPESETPMGFRTDFVHVELDKGMTVVVHEIEDDDSVDLEDGDFVKILDVHDDVFYYRYDRVWSMKIVPFSHT